MKRRKKQIEKLRNRSNGGTEIMKHTKKKNVDRETLREKCFCVWWWVDGRELRNQKKRDGRDISLDQSEKETKKKSGKCSKGHS